MDLSIKGRTALITGADSGIGLATAKILAAEGGNIVLSDKTYDGLEQAAEEVRRHTVGGNSVIAVAADVTKNEEIQALSDKATSEFGSVDIVVHCAGIHGANGNFLELSDVDWLSTIDVDLMGAVRICRAFIPAMQKAKWGRIVLVASENALQPYENDSPYNACKAAIVNLTKCLSRSFSPGGVMINCVSPAFIATPMTDEMMEKQAEEKKESVDEAIRDFLKNDRPGIVTGRRGKPEEVAGVIALLCSEYAGYIAGSNYRVDGGSVSTAFG